VSQPERRVERLDDMLNLGCHGRFRSPELGKTVLGAAVGRCTILGASAIACFH
jgi:hypothetical protein